MPDRHKPRPDYQRAYQQWRATASKRLRQAHRAEWDRYFAEARMGRELTDEQWAAWLADARQQVETAAGRTLTDDEAARAIDRDYRFSYEVGQRIMARPGFMDGLREKMAELDAKRKDV
jgi:hypothetical protein